MPFNDISQDRVIVLRSLETFTVVSTDGRGDSEFVIHTPCPSARSISIVHKTCVSDVVVVEIFPATVYWDTFIRQYTRSPVEDVTIEMKFHEILTTSTLTFRSPAWARAPKSPVAASCYQQMYKTEFSSRPLGLSGITHRPLTSSTFPSATISVFSLPVEDSLIANEVGELFGTVGALDESTIYESDL